MVRVVVPTTVAERVTAVQEQLVRLGWEMPRLIIPPARAGKRRRGIVRAVAPVGEVNDIVVEVRLGARFLPSVVKVHCAGIFGAASGQVWSYGDTRPLPTPSEARALLGEQLSPVERKREYEGRWLGERKVTG